jgi:hypothetical protein
MLTDSQLSAALELGREQSAIEFKSPGSRSNRRLVAQVVRAMLAMSNRRDGGHVVVGVADNSGRLEPIGLTDGDLATWTFDALADVVARYAEPSLRFDMRIASLQGRSFVVIDVAAFVEVPTLCRRDQNDERGHLMLREGACYVRPRRKPETMEVSTYADMRDLIDLASEKALRRFLATANRAGLALATQETAEARFDQQIEDFK